MMVVVFGKVCIGFTNSPRSCKEDKLILQITFMYSLLIYCMFYWRWEFLRVIAFSFESHKSPLAETPALSHPELVSGWK